MQIDLPSMINVEPRFNDYKIKFRKKMMQKLAYDLAMKIYWRSRLSEAQNHRCCWCGVHMTFVPNCRNSATIEHVVPRSHGGADHPDNYAVACMTCNTSRGNMPAEDFMKNREAKQAVIFKRRQEEEEKRAIVSELRKIGVHRVSAKTNKQRLEDKMAAIKAVQTQTVNPFAQGTRAHRYFERYSENGYASHFVA